MPTLPVLKARGLHTSDNQLSAVPDGAMVRADNVVINAADVVEPRRGQKYEAYSFGSSGDRAKALAFFRGGKVIQYGASSLAQSTLAIIGAGHTNDASTVSLWRLESATAPISDEKGTNPLGLNGAPTSAVGRINNAVAFAGAQSLRGTATADATSLAMMTGVAQNYTMEAWVYPTALPGADASASGIVGLSNGTTNMGLTLVNPAATPGFIKARWEINGGSGVHGTITIAQNVWTHIAVSRTWDGGATSTLRLYVNGVLDGSSSTSATQAASGHTWRIGEGNGGTDYFVGRIDDVRVSSVARSAAEILASYGLGTTGATTGYTTIAGSYAPVDPPLLRMKFVELAENLYLNTSLGLYAMESLTATPRAAGVPKAESLSAVAHAGSGSFLAADAAVAYGFVVGAKDSNGNVRLGAPTSPTTVRNASAVSAIGGLARTAAGGLYPAGKVTVTLPTGSTADPTIAVGDVVILSPGESNFPAGAKTVIAKASLGATYTITYNEAGAIASSTAEQTVGAARGVVMSAHIPAGTLAGHFIRIYRSFTVTGVGATPGPDLLQVEEISLTSSDITNGYFVFEDDTPSLMLDGAPPLYTSPNLGEGIGSANERPPLAKDIFEFDGRLWYCNTTERYRFFLNILGVYEAVGDVGIQDGDTLTLDGATFTFRLNPVTFPDGESAVYDGGSVAENIEATGLALAENICWDHPTLNCYYISGVDDAPGRLMFERKALGGAAFAMSTSRPSAFSPPLPTSGSTVTSDNSRRAHGLSFSKVGEPEAVPLTNYLADIPRGREAVRGIPLRDKAFVLVKDVGFYVLSGPAPYRLTKLDTTAKPLAPDTFVEHSNQLIGLSDQGVVSVSEGGVRILSAPIEMELLEEVNFVGAASLRLNAFAVSSEADRQYQLWLPEFDVSDDCHHAYVYNSLRNAWSKWIGNRTCGGVNPSDGLLYLGDGSANKLRVERKDYAATDFADETLAVTVSGIGTDNLSCTLASAAGVAAGDVLTSAAGGNAKLITAVNGNVLTLILSSNGSVPTGACLVWKAIACSVKYSPPRTGDPAVLKQFREACLHFARFYAKSMPVYFDSEMGHVETTGKTLTADGGSLYSVPGTPPSVALLSSNKRAEVPIEHQRSTQLQLGFRITEAWGQWRLNGYSLTFEPISEKSVR